MNLLEPVLEKVGRVLADQYGIRVRCEGQRCCTDGSTIYLPALPDDIPDELRDTIRGFLDHEVGHVAAASSFTVGAAIKKKHGPEAFGLLNILEDLRVEEFMRRRYPGSGVNLTSAYRYAIKTATEKAGQGAVMPPMKRIAFAIGSRAMKMPDLPFVDPEAYAVADRIDREIRQSATAPSTKAVARLAESAWLEVRPYLEQAANAKPMNAQNPPPKRRQRKKEPGNGSPMNEPPSPPPSGNSSPGSTGGSMGDGTENHAIPSSTGNVEVGIVSGLGDAIGAAVANFVGAGAIYRAWSTANDTITEMRDNTSITHTERMAPLMRHVAGVRQRLLQTLMAETRARWLPDQENGRLNPRALHRLAAAQALRNAEAGRRVATAQHDATEPHATTAQHNTAADALARRMFRNKVVAKRMKTAVTLLIDLSHSMEGRKIDIARNSSLVLCEAMSRLNIPVAVWGFSADHPGKYLQSAATMTGISSDDLEKAYRFAPLIHERYKRFDEPFRKISGRFDYMRTHCLTPLGESMLFAAREIAKRPEPRKVLLVLTDGRPSVSLGDDDITFQHAKATVARIEKAGIDVALVGIMESSVRDLHHRSVVVDTLEHLPGTVMAQLQRLLSRDTRTTNRNARAVA